MKQKKFNLDKYLMLAGILAFLVFFIGFFLIFPAMYKGYDISTMFISHTGAWNSPIKTIANVLGFSLWGILTMIFGYGVFRCKNLSKLRKIIGILLIIGGFAIYLVGIFAGEGIKGIFTTESQIHSFLAAFPFAPIGLATFLFIFEFAINRRLRWLILPVIIIGMASLILQYYRSTADYVLPYPGLIQRATLGLPFLMIMIIAITLYKIQNQTQKNRK